jgi:hypothetical protein
MKKRKPDNSSDTSVRDNRFSRFKPYLRPLCTVIYLSALPVILAHDLYLKMLSSGAARAWDGTGHYGIAQIYDQTIFPDTFGWTHAHFGGMPFPNFYPPLFFWSVAFLHHTQLFSFDAAFKLMVILPVLLMPGAIWLLAWTVSDRNHRIAFWAGLASLLPLISAQFGGHFKWASGLDYFSTFAIGMYTQPLGFVLLIAWFVAYVKAHAAGWRFVLSSLLLALAVLANYLNGVTAMLFVAATLTFDVLKYYGAPAAAPVARGALLRALVAHAASPLISLALTLFWLVPMFSTYEYLVTRPFTRVVITQGMIVWFILAAFGTVAWFRRHTPYMRTFITTCLILGFIITFAAYLAPRWYPLQANRFAPTLNFLLTVPVSYAVVALLEKLKSLFAPRLNRLAPWASRLTPYMVAILLLLPVLYVYRISRRIETRILFHSQATMAFYPKEANLLSGRSGEVAMERAKASNISTVLESLGPAGVTRQSLLDLYLKEHMEDSAVALEAARTVNRILQFARERRDGRYAVELPNLYASNLAAYDSHSLNSYLGSQGNETMTVIFREASPNALFMYPQVNALSYNPDNFGFSSVLADDLDFLEQPVARHLERARTLGLKYLVVHTPDIKQKLAQEPEIGSVYEFGAWSVFELKGTPPPPIQLLAYRPALLVSEFTVKGRYSNESNYIRFAEEQFFDGWFDVRLVRAPKNKLDDLGNLSDLKQFGALIIDTYECDRCDLVYRQLRDFSQSRLLLLLPDDNVLFNRIRHSIKEFPLAQVIEREPASKGIWLNNAAPMNRYRSNPIRQQWAAIRQALEQHKIPTEPAAIGGEIKQNAIQVTYQNSAPASPEYAAPVLISTSYHPNWQRQDGDRIYAANPMYMLVFVTQPTQLNFTRWRRDRVAVWASAGTLLGLVCFAGLSARRSFKTKRVDSPRAPRAEGS